MDLKFNWTVNFGDILVVIGLLITAGSYLFRSGGGQQKLQAAVELALNEISELKKEVSQINKILTQLAVQDERLTMLTKWYDELRRGVGRVVNHS